MRSAVTCMGAATSVHLSEPEHTMGIPQRKEEWRLLQWSVMREAGRLESTWLIFGIATALGSYNDWGNMLQAITCTVRSVPSAASMKSSSTTAPTSLPLKLAYFSARPYKKYQRIGWPMSVNLSNCTGTEALQGQKDCKLYNNGRTAVGQWRIPQVLARLKCS